MDLRSATLEEVARLVGELRLPPYRARQIFAWVHGRGASSTEVMTDLGRDLRRELAARVDLTPLRVDAVARSTDGTRKLRLRCADGKLIESVLIPGREKVTQCVSTQVGCALGCRFCATAAMGLARNLTAGEIVDQVYRARAHLDPGERVSNLVFMGMGEPLANLDAVLRAVELLCTDIGANLSPRRITISTVGLVPGIDALGRRAPQVGLALSLHATTDDLRRELMPVNRRWPLAEVTAALRRFPLPRRRRITIEYLLLAGLNDRPEDVRRLVRLLDGLRVKVNLLPYNPTRPDQPRLRRPDDDTVEAFAEGLRARGLTATVRWSRGLDIAAACGQLAASGEGDGRRPSTMAPAGRIAE